MELTIGSVLEGKVTGITKFGAFVSLSGGGTGMVHISEVAHSYVSDIKDHLSEGQSVKVKVIGIDENNRVNLSIKKATEPPATKPSGSFNNNRSSRVSPSPMPKKQEPQTFEDKLKLFMQASDSKMSDLEHYTNRKNGSRRGRR